MTNVTPISEARRPPPEAVIAAYKLLTGLMPEWSPGWGRIHGWVHPRGYRAPDDALDEALRQLLNWLDIHKPEGL